MDFGFLQENIYYETDGFQIVPLPDIRERIESLRSAGFIYEGWFYPPVEEPQQQQIDSEKLPKIPWRAFSLPSTHQIKLKNKSDSREKAEFIINVLGFAKGVKLIPNDWYHFYRVQIELHRSIGFYCTENETAELLHKADEFFKTHNHETQKILFGAIHWFLFSESYYHSFERFDCQYKVLDACYKLCRDVFDIKRCQHAERPIEMANFFNMPVPNWAMLERGKSKLSILRNQFYHEALFAGEPIGFDMPDGSLIFELKNFNAKLLLSILGVKAEYIRYPADQEFCLHALDMIKP